MELQEKDIETLHALWKNKLPAAERARIEQRMETDPAYRREVQAYRIFFDTMEAAGDQELLQYLQQVDAQEPEQVQQNHTIEAATVGMQPDKKGLRMLRMPAFWALAAGVALLIWIGIRSMFPPADQNLQAFETSVKNFSRNPEINWQSMFPLNGGQGMSMAIQRKTAIESILTAVMEQRYQDAESQIATFKQNRLFFPDVRVDLAHAAALSALQRYDEAIPVLETLLKGGAPPPVEMEAAWLRAICLLANSKTRESGKKELEGIAQINNHPHQTQAATLLKLWTQ